MMFKRVAAGLVAAGWLGAACAGAGPELEPAAEGVDGPPVGTAQQGGPMPTISPTVVTPSPLPIYLDPRIDNPYEACDTLFPNSTFQGYIIEKAVGSDACPPLSTSNAYWDGAVWAVKQPDEPMEERYESYFVGGGANACVYNRTSPPGSLFVPLITYTPEQRYAALKTRLGYPAAPTRDIQGILCKPPAAANVAPLPPLPAAIQPCRQCANAHASAVRL